MTRSLSIMRRSLALAAGLCLLPLAATAARAQDAAAPVPTARPATPPAPHVGNHYQGQVASIDAAAKTFTITTRFAETPLTVKASDATKVTAMKRSGLDTLKVGDRVIAVGEMSADLTSVTARGVMLLAPDAPEATKQPKKGAIGTVATTSPLTIKTEDGKTISVTTDARTMVMASQDAAFSDIAVGSNVNVKGKMDGDTFSANSIAISPARGAHHHVRPAAASGADTSDTPAPAPLTKTAP